MSKYAIDRARWASLSIFAQMGNIGAEVGRAIAARRHGDEERFEASFARTLDLFDATEESMLQSRPYRLKEILRARDQFVSLFFGDTPGDSRSLENYFTQFAVAERLKR